MKDALRVAGWTLLVFALIAAAILGIMGMVLVHNALFPDKTVCVLAHDEEHSGNVYHLCDRQVPR